MGKRANVTEHAGAKNGGVASYERRTEAKRKSRKLRRWWAKLLAREGASEREG